jgi:hypothetical protein
LRKFERRLKVDARAAVRLLVAAALACAALAVFQGEHGGEAGATVSATRAAALPSGTGSTLPVSDEASFDAALEKAKPGDTIELANGAYPELTISGKRDVTIAGGKGATLDGVAISRSSGITLRGLTISPAGQSRAQVALVDASEITLDGLLIDGRAELVGAGVVADETVSGVRITGSEITNCGRGTRCLALDRTQAVVVSGNSFHDCLSCDFIRGGSGMVVRGNTFERAIHGSCLQDGTPCPHNDLIQILGGGPWRIVGNRFGNRQGGAASIYISPGSAGAANPIHDVAITSNLFQSTTGQIAIKIKGGASVAGKLISGVSIVNNTIMSGTLAALLIEAGWENLSSGQRPLVANNIFLNMKSLTCPRGVFVANIVKLGHARCTGLRKADPALNARGGPTKGSTAVVNKADARYAPKTDYYGRFRNGRPDIGAVEFRGKKKASRAS